MRLVATPPAGLMMLAPVPRQLGASAALRGATPAPCWLKLLIHGNDHAQPGASRAAGSSACLLSGRPGGDDNCVLLHGSTAAAALRCWCCLVNAAELLPQLLEMHHKGYNRSTYEARYHALVMLVMNVTHPSCIRHFGHCHVGSNRQNRPASRFRAEGSRCTARSERKLPHVQSCQCMRMFTRDRRSWSRSFPGGRLHACAAG